jgi:RNA polymerase sigma factor (sigma-70 family)
MGTALSAEQRALVTAYLPLARKMSTRFAVDYPSIDGEDFRGIAFLALTEAALAFDTDRGTHFSQYAGPRIRGALIDAVRAYLCDRAEASGSLYVVLDVADPAPSHEATVDSAEAFEALIDSAPAKYQDVLWLTFAVGLTQAEIARRLGVTQPRVNQLLREALMCLAGNPVVRYRPDRRPRRARRA